MAGEETDTGQQTSDQMASQDLTNLISGGSKNVIFPTGQDRPARSVVGGGHPGNRFGAYTGPNRVGANNQFEFVNGQAQGPYDEVVDAKRLLSGMDPLDRKKILKDVSFALGRNYTPSKFGLTDTDINAVGYVLRQANDMGRTFDVALGYMIEQGGGFLDKEGQGSGRTYTVTSADDIKPLANEMALQLYGRALDPKAMNRIIRAVQQEEIGYQAAASGGGVVERSASPTNVITEELIRANPEEAAIQGAASVAEMLRRALGT